MKKLAFILALAFLAGCKLGKNYDGTEVKVPNQFTGSDSLAVAAVDSLINTDSLRIDSASGIDWYGLFQDPILDSLVKAGLEHNQNLLIAGERIIQAQYNLGIQRAELLPKFGYQAGAGRGNFQGFVLPDEQNIFSGVANVNWELDFWGKYRRLNESARAQLLATQEGYRAAQISLVTTIATTYFGLLEYEERLQISHHTLSLRDSTLYIIEQRFEKGVIPEIDVNQAQIQQAIAASSIPVIERQIAFYQHALNQLTGTNPKKIVTQTDMLVYDTAVSIPAGLPSDLLARRPDIIAAEQELVAQNALIGAAQANRLPSISLTGLLGVASDDLSKLTDSFPAWNISGSLAGPIFNWNQLKRQVDIEKSKTQQAIYNYEAIVIDAFREVEDILVEIRTLKIELVARNNHVTAALNAQELSEQRYDKGVTSYLEYLESQRQAFEAQQNYVGTKQQLLSAYARLYKALGGGWNL